MKKILFWLGRYHCKRGIRPIIRFSRYLDGYIYQYLEEQAELSRNAV
jgi:hypothetical protein